MPKFKINIVNINQKAGDPTNRDHPDDDEIEDLERRKLVSNSPFRNRPSQKPSSKTTKTEQNMDTNRLTSIRIEKKLTDLTTEITKAKNELSTFGRKIYNALFGNPTPPKDIEPIVPRIVELDERVKETERIASETVEWAGGVEDRIDRTFNKA